MSLLYLPLIAAIHFVSGTALGGLTVLAAKAVRDMRQEDRIRAKVTI